MEVTKRKLVYFFAVFNSKFIIPVYQRNYDWQKKHCKQLWDDLLNVIKHKHESHFLGSIVSLYEDKNNTQEFIIIDGQQRITTVSLLLLAIMHQIEEDKNTEKTYEQEKNRIKQYLLAQASEEKKIKLKLTKEDDTALNALFRKDFENGIRSHLVANYRYFRDMLKNVKPQDILPAIEELVIVDITLVSKDGDNPQLIFESLNSTGLELTEADKIRNFLLMGLTDSKEQENYHETYWVKIEQLTNDQVSEFMRHFLTIETHAIPNIKNVYSDFKEYMKSKENRDIFKKLLKFARYYHAIAAPADKYSEEELSYRNQLSPRIKKALGYLNQLGISVCYPFLLCVCDDHAEKIIDDETFHKIILIVESYIIRRFLCEKPTNALNKIFSALNREIKKDDDYKDHYLDKFVYILSQKRKSGLFPRDEEVKEKMAIKNLYEINPKYKHHLFERLENFKNREQVNLQTLVKDEQLSIEHIMPQTLSANWKKTLGEKWEEIHRTLLHTIGNLTFTAYNSEMSNRPFDKKKNMKNGFAKSKLFLNEFVKDQSKWGKKEIRKRADILTERALEIWEFPKTDYESKHDIQNAYGLDEENYFTGTKINSFKFREEEIPVDNWRDFYIKICKIFFDLEPSKFRRYTLTEKPEDRYRPFEIDPKLYISTHGSAEGLVFAVKEILDHLNIDRSEVSVFLKEGKEDPQ